MSIAKNGTRAARSRRAPIGNPSQRLPQFDSLEPRLLLSTTPHHYHHRHHHHHDPFIEHVAHPSKKLATSPGSRTTAANPDGTLGPTGLTPAQIRTAYGVNLLSFGPIVANGAGQTIAIVTAFHAPTIQNDLAAFDAAFAIPAPPSFTQVAQDGSANFPGVDPAGVGANNWELETALDVEWSHAIAPAANILLVEANDDTVANLISGGVDFARHQPGVVDVSMSWSAPEWSGEKTFDSIFTTPTTPTVHAPVVFLGATGDTGQPSGYPAYSPNVLAVGGTTLQIDAAGNYLSEQGWTGSGGGVSTVESQPAFQKGVVTQSSRRRTNPDVSLDADLNSGVSVYDSYNNPSGSPWEVVGGTSVSTPIWAGLVALADQGRSLAHLAPLAGATGLLARLYQLPSSNFHDIITGNNGFAAAPGYDLVTGLGTPFADQLIPQVVAGGPVVVGSTPNGSIDDTVSSIDINFSQPMDTTSFSPNSDITTFTGPGSLDLRPQITGFSWPNNTTLHITFNPQRTAGNYAFTLSAQVLSTTGIPLDQNGNYTPGESPDAFTDNFSIQADVVAVHLFYNNSFWNNPANGYTTDDTAIDPGKSPLTNGHTATFANYSGASAGITGIMIDVRGLPAGTPPATTFTFKTGNSSTPSAWPTFATAPIITVRRGAGDDGSDRLELKWPDKSITNTWLQLTLKADAASGLPSPYVFYFGNQIAETGNNSADTSVNSSDIIAVRDHPTSFANPALPSNPYDFNHDASVNSSDMIIARDNPTSSQSFLALIAPPNP